MNLIQTDTQINIKSNGTGQVIAGVIVIIVAVALMIATVAKIINAPIWFVLIGLLIAGIGALLLRTAENRTITISKGAETNVQATRVLGGKTENQNFPTNTIVAVELYTYIDQSGSNNNNRGNGFSATRNDASSRRSDLSLVLNNNDKVQLASDRSSGGFSVNGINLSNLVQKAPLGKEAQQVADFLQVPLQAADASNPVAAAKTIVNAMKGALGAPDASTPTPTVQPTAQFTTQPETQNPNALRQQ